MHDYYGNAYHITNDLSKKIGNVTYCLTLAFSVAYVHDYLMPIFLVYKAIFC
jgi:hypothetical protein